MDEQANNLIQRFERLIRRDPARRGLIGGDGLGPGIGELARAASSFTHGTRGALLFTGFFVPTSESDPDEGAAETDGPPGTAMLARVLIDLGIPTTVVTDPLCLATVRQALAKVDVSAKFAIACPADMQNSEASQTDFLAELSRRHPLSHAIAIERVGPGHTPRTLQQSDPTANILNQLSTPELHTKLPGKCVNMRGDSIDRFSYGIHNLFERLCRMTPTLTSIGIGDGGNEIGMGRFRWRELRGRLTSEHADSIPCRISADHTIVSGISNWGGYALAAAITVLKDRTEILARHTEESQRILIESLVNDTGAVDGVTRQKEATIDGVPFLTGIQPWTAIRRELDL